MTRIATTLKTTDFDYHLPLERIAQTPVEPRDSSRLMVVSREDGSIRHRVFRDIVEYIRPGDVLVCNESRVIPARLFGRKAGTGGKVEVLLIAKRGENVWEALVKPGRRLHDGDRIEFAKDFKSPRYAQSGLDAGPLHTPVTADDSPLSLWERARVRADPGTTLKRPPLEGQVLGRTPSGGRLITFACISDVAEPGHGDAERMLEELGVVPLPPYVHAPLDDPERYQTIYARTKGSVAAPTAGLHFTPELVARLEAMGVEFAFVTLHIGLDTFRPVQAEHISGHKMHSEFCELSEEVASKLNAARRQGRRIISVGTTSVRVLESAAQSAASKGSPDVVVPFSGWTDIFIYPGYAFRAVDALITNFHLPRSTLMMLVSAFAGKELIDRAYNEAIEGDYRFYSFGDATFIR